MAEGKVIRFDDVRGYGFVMPDDGGEDVFLHVNDLRFDKRLLSVGARVEFDVEDGDRGRKASGVRMVTNGLAPAVRSAAVSTSTSASSSSEPHGPDDEVLCDVLSVKEFLEEVTEALLDAAPTVTGLQLTQIRQRMAQLAHGHGWVES
jgi:cold shock CspA family protein